MAITLTASSSTDDLISTARAAYIPTLSTLNGSNSAYLAALITAASTAIRNYCNRTFNSASYTDFLNGPRQALSDYKTVPTLHLREYPVTAISRVATDPEEALIVTNTSSSIQRATVSTSSTALSLVRIASAVSSTNTVDFATYTTLSAVATQINTLGNGWSASVTSGFENYASADLFSPQGAASAKTTGGVRLWVYAEDVNDWWAVMDAGLLYGHNFPAGVLNIRVDYTAGYTTIPADVQDVCAKLTLKLYQADSTNMTAERVTLGPYTVQNATSILSMSSDMLGVLNRYRAYDRLIGEPQ